MLNSNHASTVADDSVFSTASSVVSERHGGEEEGDDGALSYPEPHEASYMSLTPARRSSWYIWRRQSTRLRLGLLRLTVGA
jgi:hypothetical protein